MANPSNEPGGAAKEAQPKPSLMQGLRAIFSKTDDDPDETKSIARRRKFVMAAVLGTLSINFLMFLRFFFARALRTAHQIQDRIPQRFRLRGRYQISEPVPHLGGAKHGRDLRDFGRLHAPGLHTRLEAGRKQIQVPLSWQRLRLRRRELRRSGTT